MMISLDHSPPRIMRLTIIISLKDINILDQSIFLSMNFITIMIEIPMAKPIRLRSRTVEASEGFFEKKEAIKPTIPKKIKKITPHPNKVLVVPKGGLQNIIL